MIFSPTCLLNHQSFLVWCPNTCLKMCWTFWHLPWSKNFNLNFWAYFLFRTKSKILNEINSNFTQTLLLFLCNSQFFNNPFLMAKIVDVLFLSCNGGSEAAYGIFQNIIRNTYAQNHLFPCLIKFYADIESTGASSEFYGNLKIMLKKIPTQFYRQVQHSPQHSVHFPKFMGRQSLPKFDHWNI